MSENLNETVSAEIERIQGLPLEDQVAAFAQLRDQLEAALQDVSSLSNDA